MTAFDPESLADEQARRAAGLSRRGLLVGGVVAGLALSVRPAAATAMTTDSAGLVAGEVEIPTADVTIPGYRAMPEGPGPFPLVLVVHEIFGVHAYIQDVCRRLAKIGYCAVAPYLYARQGDVTGLESIDAIMEIVAKVPDSQVMSDLDATASWAAGASKADFSRVGVTGFCWGGRIVWLYAAANPTLKAGVAWYGRLAGPTSPERPTQPLDVARTLRVPVLGLYAGQDKGIPLSDVEEMRKRLYNIASASQIMIYPTAEHGFFADYRPSFDAVAAGDAWLRMQTWFHSHGLR